MRGSEAKALVVDDDASIRLMLSKILEREGFKVERSFDGHDAIEKLENGNFDLVLLDLMMPRIDGYGVLRYLRERRPELVPNVVVLSALKPTGVQEPVAYEVTKPFDVRRIAALAREHVMQQRPRIA